jgi:hypothetical protein
MPHQFCIEIEEDEAGFHFVVIDTTTDDIVRVGLSYPFREQAERSATEYIYRLLQLQETA